ncbi:threonine/serine exporter family protein [Lutispora thermophila]|uniref:Uncharacterized membrane protein YjjP, DUF1212 family n=1 Tax=Lutispora thermophila DSM 19022 TaxID=1122184 RepID=A0A1M6FUX3_9FIRM|nr:threonine/serine exporter family protein [Lutispora thermophila]SHJ01474.1 Uncharacterized membrane protein YjjP, DUF1212 family [Lutispora thermophila DSM 19022]
MDVKEVLDIAMLSGEILLTNGSETYRVEETIERICSAYDIESECFVVPTGIFLSGCSKNDTKDSISLVKRIKERTINLHKIEMINSFSRSLKDRRISYDEAMKFLKGLDSAPSFPYYKSLLAAGVTSFAYAMLFGSSAINGIVAAFISILIYYAEDKITVINLLPFFSEFIWSFITGILAVFINKYILPINIDSVIIGSIIVLFPGIAITNGIRDALYGDILSSQVRLAEALYTVTAIGAGVGISLLLMKYWM